MSNPDYCAELAKWIRDELAFANRSKGDNRRRSRNFLKQRMLFDVDTILGALDIASKPVITEKMLRTLLESLNQQIMSTDNEIIKMSLTSRSTALHDFIQFLNGEMRAEDL